MLAACASQAQNIPPYSILYDDTQVNRIYITIDADSLNEMYSELENEYEYAVQFIFDGITQQDTLQQVGFRLRGNTSLFSAKKSFKISFNTYQSGRTFEGAKKLNLIGNHNDPSMVREKLYFDIYNYMGLPMRRVGYAELYINNDYFGFYTVTEEYDDIWLRDRYGDDSGPLFKCIYGSTLTYNGTNTGAYDTYEQQTHEQKNMKDELVMLTDVLNNTPIADLPCAIEPIFDVNQFLKIYALDISCGHWDNYGANQNNFYLYHDRISGQFKFLSYDCDNVIGVDWLGIDWADRDVYNWNFDGRPLVERLLAVDAYYERFSYYLQEIASYYMLPDYWFPKIDAMRDLIAPSAFDDVFRTLDYGYSYADFLDAFDTDDIDGHTPYGIKNFITLRNTNTLNQVELFDISPIIHHPEISPLLLTTGSTITIRTHIEDDDAISAVTVFYGFDNVPAGSMTLYDDGAHDDGADQDGIYGNTLTLTDADDTFYYTLSATDNTGNTSHYPTCDSIVQTISYTSPTLVINEILPDNTFIIPDEDGEYADFIELFNYGIYSIPLGDLSISDEPDRPTKWFLPDMLLPPGAYVLLFADNESEQGLNHVSFTLDAENDELAIHAPVTSGYAIIDSTSWLDVPSDIAWGRYPNGTGACTLLTTVTPGFSNTIETDSVPTTFDAMLTNNPGNGESTLTLTIPEQMMVRLTLYTVEGKSILQVPEVDLSPGIYSYPMQVSELSSGTYFIHIVYGNNRLVIPYIIL